MRRSSPPPRRLLVVLVALGLGLAGPSECNEVSGGAPPGSPKASLGLEVFSQGYSPMLGHWAFVEVRVWTAAPYQAFEVDLVWTSSVPVTQTFFGPRSCFDDDEGLFRQPDVDLAAGRANGLADLRHGSGAAAVQPCPVAYAVLVTDEPADLTLSVVGEVAGPDGTPFATQPDSLALAPPP